MKLDLFYKRVEKLKPLELISLHQKYRQEIVELEDNEWRADFDSGMEMLMGKLDILELAFEKRIVTIMKKHETIKKDYTK